MARQRKRHLNIFLGRSLVGRLTRGAAGDTSFDYDAGWLSWSDALPVSAFFDNLLPDNDTIRRRIAERERASSHRPFDLLAVIGRDCGGLCASCRTGPIPATRRGWKVRP